MAQDIKILEDRLQYHFNNQNYLLNALTHSSFANESKNRSESNERLEFLGDSVLGVVVADYLFRNFPEVPEGELTKKRAALVCEQACCGFSKQLGVGDYLYLSHGEQNSGGRARSSILADAFEAIIACTSAFKRAYAEIVQGLQDGASGDYSAKSRGAYPLCVNWRDRAGP